MFELGLAQGQQIREGLALLCLCAQKSAAERGCRIARRRRKRVVFDVEASPSPCFDDPKEQALTAFALSFANLAQALPFKQTAQDTAIGSAAAPLVRALLLDAATCAGRKRADLVRCHLRQRRWWEHIAPLGPPRSGIHLDLGLGLSLGCRLGAPTRAPLARILAEFHLRLLLSLRCLQRLFPFESDLAADLPFCLQLAASGASARSFASSGANNFPLDGACYAEAMRGVAGMVAAAQEDEGPILLSRWCGRRHWHQRQHGRGEAAAWRAQSSADIQA